MNAIISTLISDIMPHFISITTGALFVIALIAGIGPQTLNIMEHAINKNYTYTVAWICFVADGILIILGGFGISAAKSKIIILIVNYLGVTFIAVYLLIKIKNLLFNKNKYIIQVKQLNYMQSVLRALALTWLNPLVFIDTIIVIGGIASHYKGIEFIDFMAGAILGDFIWIFGLSFLARKFSKNLNKPIIWNILNIFSVFSMILILYKTVLLIIQ